MKTAIVTGANTGLGFQTVLGLAKNGFRVTLACRSEQKALAAMAKVKRKAPLAELEFIQLDLVDRNSIERFADSFSQQHESLDVLVNNAGVMGPPYTITQNGLELQLDANHVGHFYLTSLLFDKLDQDHETRVVHVSSLAGKRDHANIYFDNINFADGEYERGPEFMGLKGMVAYSQSKFANLLFMLELKNRVEQAGKNVKSIAVHPGVSNTDLARNLKPFLRLIVPILRPFVNVSQPAEGAQPAIYACTREDVNSGDFIGPTGKDERRGAPGKVNLPEKALDANLQARFWEWTEDQLGHQFLVE